MTRARQGYSLLGLLVAVTAISFLLLPLFLSFQTSRRGASRSLHVLTATNLATAQIEKLKRLTYRRLETILLGIGDMTDAEDEDLQWPDVINGPFESVPERPDLVEEEVHKEGKTIYRRLTFMSYFPEKNPNPDAEDFLEKRRRMLLRVQVQWDEPLPNGRSTPRKFELRTVVHDETYNPKPSLRGLIEP